MPRLCSLGTREVRGTSTRTPPSSRSRLLSDLLLVSSPIVLKNIQGSANKDEARWYVGKRCAFVYKAKNKTSVPGQAEKSAMRCIWGKVYPIQFHFRSSRLNFSHFR